MKPLRQFKFRRDAYYMAYSNDVRGFGKRESAGYIYFQVFDIIKKRKGEVHRLRRLRWFSPRIMSAVECSMSGLNKNWEYFELTDEEVERHIIMESS